MLIPEDGDKHATRNYAPGEAGVSAALYQNLWYVTLSVAKGLH